MDKAPLRTEDSAGDQGVARKAGKRAYVSQTDVPAASLDDALRIPLAISDQYGKQPATPLDVGAAIGVQPTTGRFRQLAGAAVAYGLVEGGAYADQIGLSDLGRRIVSPTIEGDDLVAKREALLRPRVVREFLEKYDGSPLPNETIGCNVLESLGVPASRTSDTLALITLSAEKLGLLRTINERSFVNLKGSHLQAVPRIEDGAVENGDEAMTALPTPLPMEIEIDESDEPDSAPSGSQESEVPNRRVFVSHGSNRKIVEQLKEMLQYGEFEPVVSVERESTSKPVPDKVLSDMRSCKYGIIHVGVEKVITDSEGKEHPQLNSNVLIEIGGAMALYPDGFILLVEHGATLPSNLQGLYEVRYEGAVLDGDATMRLLKALQQFKK